MMLDPFWTRTWSRYPRTPLLRSLECTCPSEEDIWWVQEALRNHSTNRNGTRSLCSLSANGHAEDTSWENQKWKRAGRGRGHLGYVVLDPFRLGKTIEAVLQLFYLCPTAPKINSSMAWIMWEDQTCDQIACLYRAIGSWVRKTGARTRTPQFDTCRTSECPCYVYFLSTVPFKDHLDRQND